MYLMKITATVRLKRYIKALTTVHDKIAEQKNTHRRVVLQMIHDIPVIIAYVKMNESLSKPIYIN